MKFKFLIIALLTIIPSLGCAAVFGGFEYKTSKSGVTITKYTGAGDTVVVIPSKINNVPVRSIGASAFSYCSRLTSITIPSSVRSIGAEAFYECNSLTSITIPAGVKAIEVRTFFGCYGLTSVTIPSSLKSIGAEAFLDCGGLTSIAIPNGVKSIGAEAFFICIGLTSITIPSSVKTMGSYPFGDCSNLTSIYFRGAPPRVRSGFYLGYGLNNCVAYYLPSMKKKWGASFGGIPTAVTAP